MPPDGADRQGRAGHNLGYCKGAGSPVSKAPDAPVTPDNYIVSRALSPVTETEADTQIVEPVEQIFLELFHLATLTDIFVDVAHGVGLVLDVQMLRTLHHLAP